MSLTIEPLRIQTSDKGIWSELQAANIDGIAFDVESFACDAIDWIPPPQKVVTIIITAASAVALNMFSSWLGM